MFDPSAAVAFELMIMAVICMIIGAFLFWGVTDVIPWLWHHIQWVSKS